jgi:hypothetical protein
VPSASVQLIPQVTAAHVAARLSRVEHPVQPASGPVKTAIVHHNVEEDDASRKQLFKYQERSLSYHGRVALSFSRDNSACRLYLQMPRWWSDAVWEFTRMSSVAGGSFQYRMYNMRPSNSEIFLSARDGNLKKVQELLDSGQASCLDIDQRGRSLIEVRRWTPYAY